ncbi:MAG TPA: hypothetical protein VED41_10290 [Solirubrobacteraceae bacterium]|nr:hypothetical protein [Solirubrobacteraceae bacterium]
MGAAAAVPVAIRLAELMPSAWIWMQIAIIVFVVIGMIVAIIHLA